jgi:hypothetical protein
MRRFLMAVALVTGLCGIGSVVADAQERIGRAAVIRNDVSQISPRVIRISAGDEIFRDETVRTAADSDAKFVLRDDTNLSLGPGSTLKLDRAVFSGETRVGDIAVKLSTGAFRFVTGNSSKESYKIVTPLATIGVRGTTLDFLNQRARNIVVLQDGQARVCAGGQCVDLLSPGDHRRSGHHTRLPQSARPQHRRAAGGPGTGMRGRAVRRSSHSWRQRGHHADQR